MKKEDKITVIKQISSILGKYAHFYLVNIAKLNALKTNALRRECYIQNIKLLMVKNTLFKKVLKQINGNFSILDSVLKGSTAVMFSKTANSPAMLIKKFSKGKNTMKLKAAYVQEDFYVGEKYLDLLAILKNKNELVCDVIGLLQSPVKNVVSTLQSGENTIYGILRTFLKKIENKI